jgi:tetratricopeptide (TPR) repeat protein
MNGEGLKKETSKEMLSSFIDMNDEKSLGWSLGFGLQNDSNGKSFWQWGDYGIFRNYIIAYPEQKTAVVYLTNSYNGLSVCSEMVGRSIGGQALGNANFNYRKYDSPYYTLLFGVKNGGPKAAQILIPELRKKDPEKLPWGTIAGVGSLFQGESMYPEAIAIFELILKENPTSGLSAYDLARTFMLNGDLKKAKTHYQKAKEAKKNKVDLKKIEWDMDYLQASQKPFPLDEAYMKKLTGEYGPRRVMIKDGRLYYFREGGTAPELLQSGIR